MAKLTGKGFDDVFAELRRMGDEAAGPVAEAMIEAGAAEVKKAWKATAEKYGFRKSGEMIESIDSVAPKKTDPNAIYREIYPQGQDSKTGVRNAEKAYILHYGTSTRIKASYWVDEADDLAEPPMAAAMRGVWDKFIAGRS